MTSIPRLSRMLRKLLFVEANQLAVQRGVIQRQRVFSGASLLQLLVFGWVTHPQAGPSHLARFACSSGVGGVPAQAGQSSPTPPPQTA